MKLLYLLIVFSTFAFRSPFAIAQLNQPTAFTQEEMREQARTYVAFIDKREGATLEGAIKMAYFYGYMMGHLDSASGRKDSDQRFVECTKKSPKEVVLKAARVIMSSELDRAESVRSTALLAVSMACTDVFWQK